MASSSSENAPLTLPESWISPRLRPSRVSSGVASQPPSDAGALNFIIECHAGNARLRSVPAVIRTGLLNGSTSERSCGNCTADCPSALEKQVMLWLQSPLGSNVVKACRAPIMLRA
jgi:hypothetical protein